MDRWRSGTPETCHSSHHHAICTRSLSLSLSLQVFFLLLVSFALPFFFLSLYHPLVYPSSIAPFLSHSLPPPRFRLFFPLFGPSNHLFLSTLAVIFRFHYLLWRHPSFLLSISPPPLSFAFPPFPLSVATGGGKKREPFILFSLPSRLLRKKGCG